jgi:hypothetical protein
MFQLRIYGRGGQGAVTAAEMLSVAAFLEGKYAQAFPSFGFECTGAPMVAFCRIADREIRLREPVQNPDALIVQDATLFNSVDVLEGLRPAAAAQHQKRMQARLPWTSDQAPLWPTHSECRKWPPKAPSSTRCYRAAARSRASASHRNYRRDRWYGLSLLQGAASQGRRGCLRAARHRAGSACWARRPKYAYRACESVIVQPFHPSLAGIPGH